MATVQRKHENEVADLQATVDRLLKVCFLTQQAFTLFFHGKQILWEWHDEESYCTWKMTQKLQYVDLSVSGKTPATSVRRCFLCLLKFFLWEIPFTTAEKEEFTQSNQIYLSVSLLTPCDQILLLHSNRYCIENVTNAKLKMIIQLRFAIHWEAFNGYWHTRGRKVWKRTVKTKTREMLTTQRELETCSRPYSAVRNSHLFKWATG